MRKRLFVIIATLVLLFSFVTVAYTDSNNEATEYTNVPIRRTRDLGDDPI